MYLAMYVYIYQSLYIYLSNYLSINQSFICGKSINHLPE